MKKFLKIFDTYICRILGYAIGYTMIYDVIPNVGLKEFCIVTLGGVVIIFSTILFPYTKD